MKKLKNVYVEKEDGTWIGDYIPDAKIGEVVEAELLYFTNEWSYEDQDFYWHVWKKCQIVEISEFNWVRLRPLNSPK